MFKVIVLQELYPDILPGEYKQVMYYLRPPYTPYRKAIDRRLEGCYYSFLDIHELSPNALENETKYFERFLNDYTDEASHRIRSQVLRLEEIKTAAERIGCEIRTASSFTISEPSPRDERLNFYKGWFIPNVGMDGQYVDLSCIHRKFGEGACSKIHASLIDYTEGMHRETARAKVQSVVGVSIILTEIFNTAEEMTLCTHSEMVRVLNGIGDQFFSNGNIKTDSGTLFGRAINVVNEFFIAYGFIDRASFPMREKAVKSMLRGGLKTNRFS